MLCVSGVRTLLVIIFSMAGLMSVAYNTRPKYPNPPLNQDQPYPPLLHEYEIVRLHDAHSLPILIGDGTYANVTLAQLRHPGSHDTQFVVIKTFVDSSFSTIMREVRMHRYVQNSGVTPRLIGLLPVGQVSSNISLVYQYMPYSKTISDWLKSNPGLSNIQWLHVCVKMTDIFQKLHSLDVMFNDLHSGNLLIRKLDENDVDEDIDVKIIDFGFATYKYGKPYGSYSGSSLYYYSYLAPEVKNHTITTKETDIYSMGNLFYHIAKKARIKKLMILANRCKRTFPKDRPSLKTIMTTLQIIIFEYYLQCITDSKYHTHKRSSNSKLCHQILSIKPNSEPRTNSEMDVDDLRTNFASDKYRQYLAKIYTQKEKNIIKLDEKDDESVQSVLQWVGAIQKSPVSTRCPVKIDILDKADVKQRSKTLSNSKNGAIKLSQLLDSYQYVIIKESKTSSFNDIRKESCFTGVLGELGVAPKLVGILVTNPDLDRISIVQEYFGAGQTLYDFVTESKQMEWNFTALLQFPMQPNIAFDEYDDDDAGDDIPSKNVHTLNNILNFRNKICARCSPRQKGLQYIAETLTSLLISAHRHGYIINNFNAHNIILRSDFATRSFQARLIDLGHVSRVNGGVLTQGYEYLSAFSYLAPEVKLGHRSSFTSDVYSLCYLITAMLGDYISTNIGHDAKSWPKTTRTKYETFFSGENLCFKGRENLNEYFSHDSLSKDCDRCKPIGCEYLNRDSPYAVDDRVCDVIQLESYLYVCINGPSVCRPSLYSLLKVFKRINRHYKL